jgi:hypothetical protein
VLKLQILSIEGTKWQSFCEHRLAGLSAHREFLNRSHTPESRVRIIRQNYELPNKVRAMVISADICDIIRIEGGAVSGFIFHPRNTLFPGGFIPDGTAIALVYTYPLVDDDHGSRLITGKPDAWTYEINPPEDYGNIDWVGAGGSVVSWRGPASRSFSMDSLIDYPGFVSFDYMSTGEFPVSHYTPFSKFLYQSGAVLYEFPETSKVVGATDSLVVVVTDYAGIENPDGGNGGFYSEVWQGLTERIGYSLASRPTVPWFFNPSGTEAVCGDRKLTIDTAENGTKTVSFANLTSGSGAQTKNITATDWGLTRAGSWSMYRDYGADGSEKSIALAVVSTQSSVKAGTSQSQSVNLPVLLSGTPATSLTIIGPDAYLGPQYYTAVLDPEDASMCEGGVVWSYPEGCGMGMVTATMGSVSGSKSVRMPDGHWGDLIPSGNDCGLGTTVYLTSGGSREVIRIVFDGCGWSPTNGDRDCFPTPDVPWNYVGASDDPILANCGDCGFIAVSIGGTAVCGTGCLTYSDAGVLWDTSWVHGCLAGTQPWECVT